MGKVKYNNITFDSDLEVEYYKHLKEQKLEFIYHPKKPIYINSKNTYTPDFIVFYEDRIEIIETKGFNQFSHLRDSVIHNAMLEKNVDELADFLRENGFDDECINGTDIIYRKIKYLQSHGWVDFDFKNPNTIANKRKNKIIELEAENKELREYKKNAERYFSYCKKIAQRLKLTKPQVEWMKKYEKENIGE
jgi:hypothetical protein